MILTLIHMNTKEILFTGTMKEMNRYCHEKGHIIYDWEDNKKIFYALFFNEETPEIEPREEINPNRLFKMFWKEKNQFVESRCSPWSLNCMITDNISISTLSLGEGFPIEKIAALKTEETLQVFIGKDNIKIKATNQIAN